MNTDNMNTDLAEKLEAEANSATLVLSATVRDLMDGGVQPAALVEALAAALGVMMAAAPRHMADAIETSVVRNLREQRAATWAEIDAAPKGH